MYIKYILQYRKTFVIMYKKKTGEDDSMPSSSVYRDLTAEELRAVVEGSLHTKIIAAEHLTGGLFNTALPMADDNRIRRCVYTMMWSLFDSYVWHNQYHVPDSTVYTKKKAMTQIHTLQTEFGIGRR